MKTKLLATLTGFVLFATSLLGQVPQLLNYQGRVAVGTPAVNFDGTGQFRFALVNAGGTTSYWSNDGTSIAGSQPTAAVPLTVTKGLYSVLLGDTTLANMTAIPATVWTHPDVRLRVRFDDGINGAQLLSPDQRIAAVGYAMMADNVKDGAITSAKIGAGAVGSGQLADLAVTGSKLRLGTEVGTAVDGVRGGSPGTLTFTRTFVQPFSTPPAVNLLTPGWTLGPVTATGFSATIAYAPLTLDSTGAVGTYNSLAVVNGNPAISYYDGTNYDLKFVRATDAGGSAWGTPITVSSVGTVGWDTSLAVVNGNPAISFHDATNGDLKYVRATDAGGTAWGTPVTLDSTGTVGYYTALAVVNGNPAVSYYDATNSKLKFVRATDASGTAWGTPITVSSVGIGGWYTSLKVVNGNPAISYYDNTNGDLKYVSATDASGTAWATPVTPDSTGTVGIYTSLAVVNGTPAISYYDSTNSNLRFVRASDASGTAWGTPVTLDSTGTVGSYTSLAVVNGYPAISHHDNTNGDLKYISATDASGTTWATPVTLDSTGTVGTYTSLAGVNGNPGVSYYDATNANLKFVAIPEALRWQASDGSVAPLTAATVTAGAIGSAQLAPDLTVSGTLIAGNLQGDGAGLTNIPASAVVPAPPGMVLIPAGAFTMGNSVAADTDITNAVPVTANISAFYMDVNLVSWSQWQSVYYWATNHGYDFVHAGVGKAANHPVQTLDWYDCVKWCNARSEQAGKTPVYYTDAGFTTVYRTGEVTIYANWSVQGYRLPTEAEWEKAARGGLNGQRFPWGNVISQNLANYYGNTTGLDYDLGPNGYNPIGSIGGTSPATSPVGSFAANGYGLYDMAGNVFEWCWDWYGTPYGQPTTTNPTGPGAGSDRVFRGGGWGNFATGCRSADRRKTNPTYADYSVGFRAVLAPQ